jgi:SAM-dependent methyltransferase
VAAAGGRPIGLDPALGMLLSGRADRPPAVQGDAGQLPFGDDRIGAVVAAVSLNHVDDAVGCLREAARVVMPGGPLVASSYAADDSHPVKSAVEQALQEVGWELEPWYESLRAGPVAALATVERFTAVGEAAGLSAGCVALRVGFDHLGPLDLVDWRLGMAQHAPFVSRLPPATAQAVRERAVDLLGSGPPVLERSILVLTAVV